MIAEGKKSLGTWRDTKGALVRNWEEKSQREKKRKIFQRNTP